MQMKTYCPTAWRPTTAFRRGKRARLRAVSQGGLLALLALALAQPDVRAATGSKLLRDPDIAAGYIREANGRRHVEPAIQH